MQELKIPEGYQTLMPYLILRDPEKFFSFTKKVFGATEKLRTLDNNKRIMHAEIQIDGSTIMYGESSEQWPEQTAGMYIHVRNADETYKKALEAGATSIQEPADRDYGQSGGVKDPFGNTWWITEVIK